MLIVVIFLIFGGRLLPRMGRSFGQSITGMKKGLKEGTEQSKSAVAEQPEPGTPAAGETTTEASRDKDTEKDL